MNSVFMYIYSTIQLIWRLFSRNLDTEAEADLRHMLKKGLQERTYIDC